MKIIETKTKSNKIDSKLFWNKAGTTVGGQGTDGEKVMFKEFPDWLNASLRKITYRITYEEGKLLFLSPVTGIFKVKFVEFQHKDDEPLAPVAREGSGEFGPWTQYQFRASLRMIEPDLNGMPVTFFGVYGTDKRDYIAPNGGKAALARSAGSREAKAFLLLQEFLEATGLSEIEFDFKDNLLPEFEKAAKKLNRVFSVVFEKGYITKIVPSDEEFAEEDEVELTETEDDEDELEGFDTDGAPF